MIQRRTEVRHVVHSLMNEVIEQGFQHLVHHPQQSDELNKLVIQASEELQQQLTEIDNHPYQEESNAAKVHFRTIAAKAEQRSLELLAWLQRIQRRDEWTGA